jgi:hypothetical protein
VGQYEIDLDFDGQGIGDYVGDTPAASSAMNPTTHVASTHSGDGIPDTVVSEAFPEFYNPGFNPSFLLTERANLAALSNQHTSLWTPEYLQANDHLYAPINEENTIDPNLLSLWGPNQAYVKHVAMCSKADIHN